MKILAVHGAASSEDIFLQHLSSWPWGLEPTVSVQDLKCCFRSRVWKDIFQTYKTLAYKRINAGLLVIGYFLHLLIWIISFPVSSFKILRLLGKLTVRERITYSHSTCSGRIWKVALLVCGMCGLCVVCVCMMCGVCTVSVCECGVCGYCGWCASHSDRSAGSPLLPCESHINIYQRRQWLPTPVFLPGECHGQWRLVGYSPWGCKESNMSEWLTSEY